MATFFILYSDGFSERSRYKKLLDDLKSSANRGRDEYPITLTEAFDLLARESGEYATVRSFNPRWQTRRGRGGRGRGNFLFAEQSRGARGNQQNHNDRYSRINENNSEEIVQGTDGETHPTIACF